MTKKALLDKVIAIEAFASELKTKAAGLRKDMIRFHGSSPAGVKRSLSNETRTRLVGNRKKSIIKNQPV